MRPSDDFIQHCRELLSSLGPCQSKRMFGGVGISVDGLTVAILDNDVLYLKVNDDTRSAFEKAGGQEFQYGTKTGTNRLHYWTVPDEAMESTRAMAPWAKLAMRAALAARGSKKPANKKVDSSIVLRDPIPGDIGTIISKHGSLYASEFGYDISFEALVAKIAGEFIETHDSGREKCWVAVKNAQVVGSVFLVQKSKRVAKLRLLYVDQSVRGTGLGKQLVRTCMDHAKSLGYQTMVLWTQSHLEAARGIYRSLGWQIIAQEAHYSFGKDLIAETWQVTL